MRTFTVVDVEQRSDQWFQSRLGRLTGSSAAAMMTLPRSGKGEAAGRRNLRVRLALERITKRSLDSGFQSKAMEQGIALEVDASAMYEALTGRLLDTTGFLSHNAMMAGCSLDGNVNDFEGIIEVKSPIAATHLDYLRTGKIPTDYLWQVLNGLWITGADWCDWLSYQPDFPEALQVKLVRVHRNEAEIKAYELAVSLFLSEVEAEVKSVEEMARKAAA